MQAPIVTLTMNPALDVSISVDRVVPERKLRSGPGRFDPGGGGINVTRAIRNLGGSSTAVYPLGGPTGEAYRSLAEAAGVSGHVIRIAGETRESFTVHDSSTGELYRFILPGPEFVEREWRACLSVVGHNLPRGGFLVASGSLPPGVPADFYARVTRLAAGQDVRVVVDASGPALEAALAQGLFLIKPSRDELAELVGAHGELDTDEQLRAVGALVTEGRAEHVALSLGGEGALLAWADGTLRLSTPRVEVASAVGAGDAFLAGLVLRLAEGQPIESAFRTAVAAGSATAAMPATELCSAEDVATLEGQLGLG
ncbi:1-phosphofructokinase family hexose kinase [Mycetocola miduiensis]|uniref:6-phosphofructokinase n=1 Tax=Mycetocola miduiensis TaxID=995034 RepID=A0A1I4ZY20_9MICO|nr:1-phosphofructokinase family hexose kinase [Mycetocola miduiensis]SFN55076.1 6-phosphofructokinase [Mycetocola miduiensis]